MFTSLGEKSGKPVMPLQSPTVNVIKSNAQVNSYISSIPIESLEAADGDTSKRTYIGAGGIYVLDQNLHANDPFDYFHNAPVVH